MVTHSTFRCLHYVIVYIASWKMADYSTDFCLSPERLVPHMCISSFKPTLDRLLWRPALLEVL